MTDERSQSLAAQAAAWVPPWERAPREPDRAYQAAATEPDDSDDLDDLDAGEVDADAPDADAPEADQPASGAVDAGGPDAGGPPDAGEPDAGEPDAGGPPDAGEPDAGEPDAGEPDAGEPDAGEPDAGEPDTGGSDLDDHDPEEPEPDEPEAGGPVASAGGEPAREPVGQPDDDEQLDEAGLSDDDDFDPEFEGGPAPLPGETSEPVTVDHPADLPGDSGSPTDVRVGPDLPVPASIEQAAEDDEETGNPVDAPLLDGDDAGDVFDQAADDDVSDDADVDLPFEEDARDSDEGVLAEDEREPDEDAGTGRAGPARADAGRDADPGDGNSFAAGAAIPAQGGPGREPAAASGDQNARTEDDLDLEPAPMEEAELRGALESVLLVVDEPVGEMQLAQILEQPTERVAAMLEDISARYTAAGHGFDLRRAAGGWRLYTRPEYAAYVERFVLDGQSVRLTQAALETLAVVAYKQPVTRSRISAIRGVNCDGVMRTLATRGLIEECGTEPETGAHLYRTTTLFLEKLGLNSVDQLPPLAPFLPDDVEEVLDASG